MFFRLCACHTTSWSINQFRQLYRLQVDVEILRGISLSESLKQRGILWRRSPMDMSKEDSNVSQQMAGLGHDVVSIILYIIYVRRIVKHVHVH